jgi:hypothetical protein
MTDSANPDLIAQDAASGVAECTQAVIGSMRRSPLIGANTIRQHLALSEGGGLDRSSEILAAYPLADLTFGLLVALRGICAVLISGELIDASSLQEDLKRRIDFLKSTNQAAQALPIEDLSDAVDRMMREKADVDRVLAASRHLARSEGIQ